MTVRKRKDQVQEHTIDRLPHESDAGYHLRQYQWLAAILEEAGRYAAARDISMAFGVAFEELHSDKTLKDVPMMRDKASQMASLIVG